jgi:hypothetical protein
MTLNARKPLLAALALVCAVIAGDAIAGKSDRYGRQVITYEAPVVPGDAGTWTRPAPMPVEIQSGDGGTPSVRNVAPASLTEGCMRVECSLVGDAGVVMGIIPVDAGTFFPQANTRYIATLTTATGVRIANQACNNYATGQGRLVAEGAVLDWTTGKNPDGGVGNLALHCCSLAASSASAPALFQLCPVP